MNKIIFLILFVLGAFSSIAQIHFREIVIKKDTTIEYNSPNKHIEWVEPNIDTGLGIHIVDNPFRLFYFYEVVNNNLNGLSMSFYIPSNMPKEKGYYLRNQKNGEWFYWNENGVLLRKEVWEFGKLIKTIKSN